MDEREKAFFSKEQLVSILDHSPTAIVVSTLDTHQLLYANAAAQKAFHPDCKEDPATCYQAFGYNSSCPACPVGQLSGEELYTRELDFPESGQAYQLSGQIIDWVGRKAHIEYIRDISEQRRLERKLTDANEKTRGIIDAIPGGVAIYKVSDILETVYFSGGVAELTGYSVEEYRELIKGDAAELTYPEDTAMVLSALQEMLRSHTTADLEFRKQHRDGHIVWVHAQAKQIGEEDGCPLVQCVFHNISAFKEAQQELHHLINSIPGGIASYRVENGRFIPTFYSNGVMELSGHTREEYGDLESYDAMGTIYEQDRPRVLAAAQAALQSGEVLDVSYRMRHKNGKLIWVHLNGRRMGPLSSSPRFYAVFTGMSQESRLFQSIANETADGIYVIDQKTYELLYISEAKKLFPGEQPNVGQSCYEALHGRSEPCEFCTLKTYGPDGRDHEFSVNGTDRFYIARFKETDWNGIPAYVQYIRDATDEVRTRREKERLEAYYQALVQNLPGGIAVIRCEPDGRMTPEYISEGFAAMTQMTMEEVLSLYQDNVYAGIHSDDVASIQKKLQEFMEKGEGHLDITGRMKKGGGGYLWVKAALSTLGTSDGVRRLYLVYTDITKTVEEKEQLIQQHEDLILQHYRKPGPDTLVLGHCNITQNKIIEIWDATDSELLDTFGGVREDFFSGLASLVADPKEQQEFKSLFLNAPALAAFQRKDTEQLLNCFIRLPREKKGRYVQFKMILVEAPDTGDVTGILTVTDITGKTIADRILHQISVTSHDYVADLDLDEDSYTLLTCNPNAGCVPPHAGCHSGLVAEMAQSMVVPKDQEQYVKALELPEMKRRLQKENVYTVSYSLTDERGDFRTKNIIVSAIDLRLGRACLTCTDITDSVREQQGLLNMLAYTFELAGIITVSDGRFVMYTRQTVLENLPPHLLDDYDASVKSFTESYLSEDGRESIRDQFRLKAMLQRLSEKPAGYDFVFCCQTAEGLRYKQINVLWGDAGHRTVCMVRGDVTEILATERESKKSLEKALNLAEEANRAKSDFLSAMSHDIRTPMNAIMGMTNLAVTHLGDQERVADCLKKISYSSKHLLSLINDVLDMSKIEQSKIKLNRANLSLPGLVDELSVMLSSQAIEAGLHMTVRTENIVHPRFYGDSLRINQILINLLSNAIKFTPKGGRVDFLAEEVPPAHGTDQVRYRFTVSDTGIGMTEDFISHMFDPFARGGRAQHIEGTGLGLSITKGLVERMGGKITVESRVDEGSTFRVELESEKAPEPAPIMPKVHNQNEIGNEPGSLFSGRTFLVAEDNAINAEILCELLKMYGAEAVVKADGMLAVRAFEEAVSGTYDAILMDIQMPEMNGYEATEAIRRMNRPDAKTIPIVAMTANAFSEDVQKALDAGMNAHVAKPIDVDVLQETLYKVLMG